MKRKLLVVPSAMILLALLILTTTSVAKTKNFHGTCREQDTAELLRSIKSPDSETLHPSFLMMAHFRQLTSIKNPQKLTGTKTFKVNERWNCRSAKNHVYRYGGNICPSHHVIEYDPDRVPSSIVQVECSCPHCQRLSERDANEYRCEKDYQFTRVLRRAGCSRSPVNGDMVMQYTKEWEAVSVGCSCRYLQEH